MHILPDAPPSTCTAGGGKRLALEVTNGCGGAVDMFWVDFGCKEVFRGRIEAARLSASSPPMVTCGASAITLSTRW
jgi:hypothetical protein